MAIIQMERQGKTWAYLSRLINTSPTYTKQVVKGMQSGPAAKRYKQIIADDLGIILVKTGGK